MLTKKTQWLMGFLTILIMGVSLGHMLSHYTAEMIWESRYVGLGTGVTVGTLVASWGCFMDTYNDSYEPGAYKGYFAAFGFFTVITPALLALGWLEWQVIHWVLVPHHPN